MAQIAEKKLTTWPYVVKFRFRAIFVVAVFCYCFQKRGPTPLQNRGLHAIIMPNTHRRRRRDSTVELSRVGGVNAPVGSRDPVYNFL